MAIVLDGALNDWSSQDRLDLSGGGVSGYGLYGRYEAGTFSFAINAPSAIGPNTTLWLNTDRDKATGYKVWGFAAGAEFNINFDANGVPRLYTGADGQTLVAGAVVNYAFNATKQVVELSIAASSLNGATSLDVYTDVNNAVFLPGSYDGFTYTVAAPSLPTAPVVVGSQTLDGNLTDWSAASRIDNASPVAGHQVYGTYTDGHYVFAISAPTAIGPNTTLWLNTDRDKTTGYKVWGFAAGAEYNINFDANGVPRLYTGADGQTLVAGAVVNYAFNATKQVVELSIAASSLNGTTGLDLYADINNSVFLPSSYDAFTYSVSSTTPPSGPVVIGSQTLDGALTDWTAASRIDGSSPVTGFEVFGKSTGDHYVFALKAPAGTTVGANTTFWLNTDRNVATGFDIFTGSPAEGGAEFNINFDALGTPYLYSGGAGQTLITTTPLAFARSADGTIIEVAVAKGAVGSPQAIDVLIDVNNTAFLPASYAGNAYTVREPVTLPPRTDPSKKVAIVFSETTAARYFGDPSLPNQKNINETAYAQLFMAAQNQAAMAGIPFDVISEADLKTLSGLVNYDAIVFPSFQFVKAGDVTAIQDTLQSLVQNYQVSLITAGNFMTSDENGVGLAGDPYARMKLFFDLQPNGGGFPANVTLKSAGSGFDGVGGYTAGEVISTSANTGYLFFADATPTSTPLTTIATQTVGTTTAAAIVTSTLNGDRNVHFSTEAQLGDNNQLWQAIQYAVNGASGPTVGLQMGRQGAILASRVDMDLSRFPSEVDPAGSTQGIYDKLLPILAEWKAAYNLVGSYYVNVGDDPANGEETILSVSLPYYKQLIDMGNEIGSHSLTHLGALNPAENTNILKTGTGTFDYEFRTARDYLQANIATVVPGYKIAGVAVPGAPEYLSTAREIIQYHEYMSGGYASVGAGYPGAFGYLTPEYADTGQVYIAPNMSFDFTLIGFKQLTAAQALAAWQAEFANLTKKADVPVVVWPWHDYGPTNWENNGYTLGMFTEFIKTAVAANSEFVTLEDLADRIRSFEKSTLTSSVSGNIITATVTSPDASKFAIDLDNLGSQKIASVAGWYAYDNDSVFTDKDGGTFTITLGTSAADVTHIIDMGDRNELITLSGNGTDLSATIFGEGNVVIDLKNPAGLALTVTGGTIVSQVGEILTVNLGPIGTHTLGISLGAISNSAPVITSNGGGATASLTVAENTTAIITTVTASDANAGQTKTFSIDTSAGSGADGTIFTIDPVSGALRFKVSPDFETPLDAGANNTYDVTVKVTDSGTPALSDIQTLAIRVTDVAGATYNGTNGANTYTGTGEPDIINGSGGNDILDGGAGNDRVTGGSGIDRLTGGAGADIFVFGSSGDIGNSTSASGREQILDFVSTKANPLVHDVIDLTGIDANTSLLAFGDQAFTLLAKGAAITGPAQLAWTYDAASNQTIISGNTNSTTTPEFRLALVGNIDLSATDFLL